jgi:hypothetical protein
MGNVKERIQTNYHNKQSGGIMKHVVVCLALVAMIFAIGCQENNITSPITTAGPAGLSSGAKLASDVIFLDGEVHLRNMDAVHGSWILDGQANYTLTQEDLGVKVSITMDGALKPTYVIGYPGVVTGQSTEIVEGVGNQPIILEREYLFDCGNGERILHINFAVSETYISVDAVWVVVPLGFGGISAK